MLYAARECARIALTEGLEERFVRHNIASEAVVSGLEAMGLEVFGDQSNKMPNVTGVVIPSDVVGDAVRTDMLEQFSIEIGTSFGPLHGKIWRIGTMGYGCRKDNVLACLTALEACLRRHGHATARRRCRRSMECVRETRVKDSAFHSIALNRYPDYDAAAMAERSREFAAWLDSRRTVRDYDPEPVPREVIESCIRCTAPSGANRQPWHFVAVSDRPPNRKSARLRRVEERAFYAGRAPKAWLDALAPLGTDPNKPFLEVAPWLIAVFLEKQGIDAERRTIKNYYSPESVGIAVGFLLGALHTTLDWQR